MLMYICVIILWVQNYISFVLQYSVITNTIKYIQMDIHGIVLNTVIYTSYIVY